MLGWYPYGADCMLQLKTFPSIKAMSAFISAEALPSSVGGSMEFDHAAWLAEYLVSRTQLRVHVLPSLIPRFLIGA